MPVLSAGERRSEARDALLTGLRLPVLGAPMFRASTPDLVIAQCRAGIIGSMPSRSVREASQLPGEISRIRETLRASPASNPLFAINLVIHSSNPRLEVDLQACIAGCVPLIITSLGVDREIVDRIHDYGGLVLHDVTTVRHARRAIAANVDGLVAVCAGAGGHTGSTSPFAFIRELRREYDGVIAAAGAIADGYAVNAAITLGADLAYVGTRFIASEESGVENGYREMIVASESRDVITSSWLTGIPANFLASSFPNAGLDLASLPPRDKAVSIDNKPVGWGEIWGAGQGAGVIDDVAPVRALVERMKVEFDDALTRMQRLSGEYLI